jgi:hypothetical protein
MKLRILPFPRCARTHTHTHTHTHTRSTSFRWKSGTNVLGHCGLLHFLEERTGSSPCGVSFLGVPDGTLEAPGRLKQHKQKYVCCSLDKEMRSLTYHQNAKLIWKIKSTLLGNFPVSNVSMWLEGKWCFMWPQVGKGINPRLSKSKMKSWRTLNGILATIYAVSSKVASWKAVN